ncbi:hypothetical protein [Paenibacillus sp. P32E]|nr:hypothetical protein [Paenibacillus sp. P32E]
MAEGYRRSKRGRMAYDLVPSFAGYAKDGNRPIAIVSTFAELRELLGLQ